MPPEFDGPPEEQPRPVSGETAPTAEASDGLAAAAPAADATAAAAPPPAVPPTPGGAAEAAHAPLAAPAAADPLAAAVAGEPGAPAGPEGDADPAAPAAAPSRLARFRAWRFAPIVEVLGTIAVALLLAESVQAAVVKPFVIPSESMEPTLLPGQRVLVNRLAYDFGSKPARGDIVVFHPPASLVCRVNVPVLEPCPAGDRKPSNQYFVKRVMGLPGDHLWIENGHPVINGTEIKHEPYITPCGNSSSCQMPHPITIPQGYYYMLGDNRGDSDDSRYWGPVRASWIVGEVFATYWPPDRIGIF